MSSSYLGSKISATLLTNTVAQSAIWDYGHFEATLLNKLAVADAMRARMP